MAELKPFGWIFSPKLTGAKPKDAKIEVKPNPVVFCRDCEEYIEWLDGQRICGMMGSYYGNTEPDDYCSRGKAKIGAAIWDYYEARKQISVVIQDKAEVSGDD